MKQNIEIILLFTIMIRFFSVESKEEKRQAFVMLISTNLISVNYASLYGGMKRKEKTKIHPAKCSLKADFKIKVLDISLRAC